MTESRAAVEASPSIFFEIYALGGAIKQLLAKAMSESPLSPEDYAIYSAIFEDERVSPTGLARLLGVPLTTAIDQIARLEARGHAQRFPDPRDRRASLVTLTATGQAAHRAANVHFERAYRAFARSLADEDAATRVLQSLRSAVDRASQSLVAGIGK
jgi:DNA-binding MarR family transcriptional regulator